MRVVFHENSTIKSVVDAVHAYRYAACDILIEQIIILFIITIVDPWYIDVIFP